MLQKYSIGENLITVVDQLHACQDGYLHPILFEAHNLLLLRPLFPWSCTGNNDNA